MHERARNDLVQSFLRGSLMRSLRQTSSTRQTDRNSKLLALSTSSCLQASPRRPCRALEDPKKL